MSRPIGYRLIEWFNLEQFEWLFSSNGGIQKSKEIYAESHDIMAMSYARAKGIYDHDLDYENRHRMAYMTRNEAYKWVIFAIITMLVSLITFIAAYKTTSNLDNILIMPVIWLIALAIRQLHFRKVGFYLMHTSNRINSFLSRTDVDENGNHVPEKEIIYDYERARGDVSQTVIIAGITRANVGKEAGIEGDDESKTDSALGVEPQASVLQSEPESAPQAIGEAENPSGGEPAVSQVQPMPVKEAKVEHELAPEPAPELVPEPAHKPEESMYSDSSISSLSEEEFELWLLDFYTDHETLGSE